MGSDYMSVQQLLNNSAFQLCLFTEPPYLTSNRHQIRLKGAGDIQPGSPPGPAMQHSSRLPHACKLERRPWSSSS